MRNQWWKQKQIALHEFLDQLGWQFVNCIPGATLVWCFIANRGMHWKAHLMMHVHISYRQPSDGDKDLEKSRPEWSINSDACLALRKPLATHGLSTQPLVQRMICIQWHTAGLASTCMGFWTAPLDMDRCSGTRNRYHIRLLYWWSVLSAVQKIHIPIDWSVRRAD